MSYANTSHVVTSLNGREATNGTIYSDGYYILHAPGSSGDTINLQICGVNATQGTQTWSCNTPGYNTLNISINTSANGVACTYACGCSGGFCNSRVCASSAPSATPSTDTGGGGGSSGGGASSDVITTSVPIVQEKTVITDTAVVNDLLSSLTPADLGVSTLDSSNVEVVKTGTASATETTTIEKVESALSAAIDEAAKQAISEIKSEISSSSSQFVEVSAKLEVYNVTSKETNKTSAVSKITLTLKADRDMKGVKVVEVIPKSVAAKVSEIVFSAQPIVLQADPIVQWNFDSISKGETKDLSYTVKKSLASLASTTVAAAQAEKPAVTEEPKQEQPVEKKPFDWTIIYIVIAIIIAAGAIFYFTEIKKKTAGWKPKK